MDECRMNGTIHEFSPGLVEVRGQRTFIGQDNVRGGPLQHRDSCQWTSEPIASAIRSPDMSSTSNNKTDREMHPDAFPLHFDVHLALQDVPCIGRHCLQRQQNNTYCDVELMIDTGLLQALIVQSRSGCGAIVARSVCLHTVSSLRFISSILCDQQNMLFPDMLQAFVSRKSGECLSRG